MTKLPVWALVPIIMILVACSGQTQTPAGDLKRLSQERRSKAP